MYESKKLVIGAGRSFVAGGVLALALAGCGTGQSSSTSTVGSTGAVISLGSGLTLTVPQGAVSSTTQMTLQETEAAGYSDIQVDPASLPLAQAATLSWADEGDDSLESDLSSEVMDVHRDGGRAWAGLHHCGHFRHWHHCGKDAGVDGGSCPGHAARDGGDLDHDADGGSHHGFPGKGDGGWDVDGDDDGGSHHGFPGGPGGHGGGGCSGHHDGGTAPSPDAGADDAGVVP